MKKYLPILFILPLWIIFFFSKFMPRDKNLIVFGTHTKSFSGNIKALFLNRDNLQYKKVFISTDQSLIKQLNDDKHIACNKYSIQGILYSLKAGMYIYSSYPSDINFWLSGGAKYVNAWHGTPIKKIERDVITGHYSLRNKHSRMYQMLKPSLFIKPDILFVASEYEEKCFRSAFGVGDEIMFRAFPPRLESLNHKTIDNSRYYNILYVPTWRDDHSFSFVNHIDLESFNNFLERNNIKFYIKLHPSDASMQRKQKFSNITTIDQGEDVYDYLLKADLLVSDYSSMIFESFYLSKPVALFCPDYSFYQKKSRQFYIDPREDLPAMVSISQKGLEGNIIISLSNKKIDRQKLDVFKPYNIENKILKKLAEKVYSEV